MYEVGKSYLIRTVTNYYTGTVTEVGDLEIKIKDAAWVAHAGRFHRALMLGQLQEVEPYPEGEIIIGRQAVVDAAEWKHALPRDVVPNE